MVLLTGGIRVRDADALTDVHCGGRSRGGCCGDDDTPTDDGRGNSGADKELLKVHTASLQYIL